MNIFALHPDPAICASMHCDQHLHKMILESAQMLSVAGHKWYPLSVSLIYKPAYQNHPCTLWVQKSKGNAWWLIDLCKELELIRESLGSPSHSSMNVIDTIRHFMEDDFEFQWMTAEHNFKTEHIFAGPDQFRLRPDLNIHQKYQRYYIHKYQLWLDTGHPMSYKGRSLPGFLSPYKDSINHG